MRAPQTAKCCRQWVMLTEKCSGARARMQAKMNHDIISAPRLTRSLDHNGEGSTSGKPPTFATPSVPIPPLFSCRDTAGKSARFRVESCCNPYPLPDRAAFAFSPPHPRTTFGRPYGFSPLLATGTIRAPHVPQGGQRRVRCSLCAGSVGCP